MKKQLQMVKSKKIAVGVAIVKRNQRVKKKTRMLNSRNKHVEYFDIIYTTLYYLVNSTLSY